MLSLANENNIELNEDDLTRFEIFTNKTELSDDELYRVNGGVTRYCSSFDTPEFNVGDRAHIEEDQSNSKGWDATWNVYVVQGISSTKFENGHGHNQWQYTIYCIETGITCTKFEFELAKEA